MEPEIFVDSKGEFGIDNWVEMLGRFPKHSEHAMSSALKAEGYRMQQMIKIAIQRGGEPKWKELNPHTPILRKRKSGKIKTYREKKIGKSYYEYGMEMAPVAERIYKKNIKSNSRQLPLQKLAGATRYIHDQSSMTTTIGFLDRGRRGLGKMHAAGFKIPVTSRMRKMLFASGMPLKKDTTELTVPARPVVSTIFEREKRNIINNIKVRTVHNIYRYLTGKPKDWDADMRDDKGNYNL